MEKSGIERIIKLGEGKEIEYKETKPEDNLKYLKTVVAFSNWKGRTIVFGIEDKTLNVVGIPKEKLFPMMDAIVNAISDCIYPQVAPEISPLTVDGKDLILLRIPEGAAKPYFIKSLGIQGGVFYRMGGTTREADEILVKELIYEGSKHSYDSDLFATSHFRKEKFRSSAPRCMRRQKRTPLRLKRPKESNPSLSDSCYPGKSSERKGM